MVKILVHKPIWWDEDLQIKDRICKEVKFQMDKVSMEVKISMDKEMEMFNLLLWESVEEWWDLKEIALKFQTKIITDQDKSNSMVEIIPGLEMWVLWAASLHNMVWEVYRVPKEWTDHNKTI